MILTTGRMGNNMIYMMQYPKGRRIVDTDKIAGYFKAGGRQLVSPVFQEDREKFVEFLESEGYFCVEEPGINRDTIINSNLPIYVDLKEKTISRMGNVTCAAAIAGHGFIMSDRDFYLLYSYFKSVNL